MRILQITDLHFSSYPFEGLDIQTGELIERLVQEHKPDLLAVTGDLISNYRLMDALPIFEGVIKFLDSLDILVAITYGNHDSEGTYFKNIHDRLLTKANNEEAYHQLLSKENDYTQNILKNFDVFKQYYRADMMNIVNQMKNHVTKKNLLISDNKEMFVVDVNKSTRLLFVDSGDYDSKGLSYYDSLSFEQQNWIVHQANDPQKICHLFIHIPLPEYANAVDTGKAIGFQSETVCSPDYNTGTWARLKLETNVKAIYCGHDHNNDFSADYFGIQLNYGRTTGYNSYGILTRGGRIIDIEGQNFHSFVTE